MIESYKKLLHKFKTISIVTIIVSCFAALSEGIALTALIPLFNVLVNGREYSEYQWTKIVNINDKYEFGLFCIFTFVVLALCSAIFRSISEIMSLKIKTKVESYIRYELTNILINMEWKDYIKLKLGDISKAMVVEGMQIGSGVMYLIMGFSMISASICYLVWTIYLSYELTFYTLIFGIFAAIIYIVGLKFAKKYSDQLSSIVSDIGDKTNELYGNMKYFAASGRMQTLKDRSEENFTTYEETYFLSQIFPPILKSTIEVLASILVAMFLYMTLMLNKNNISEAVVFIAIFYRMIPKLINAKSYFFQARTHLTWIRTYEDRLKSITIKDTQENIKKNYEINNLEWKYGSTISFENVTYIADDGNIILKNVNFTISYGDKISISGASGSGKSTVIDLILGLLTPNSGKILINNLDLKSIDINSWRLKIGLVLQESMILNKTIAENIEMFGEKRDYDKLIKACQTSCCHEFIDELDEGVNTIISENGARISGGQRQRICIARALYIQPSILILDEATSGLDYEIESKIISNLAKNKDITLIMISHRLENSKVSNKIININNKKINEFSAWSEFIENQNSYDCYIESLNDNIK